MFYEVKKNFEAINKVSLKEAILAQINKKGVQAIRLVRSQKNMIFKYTDNETHENFDIVISNQELIAA